MTSLVEAPEFHEVPSRDDVAEIERGWRDQRWQEKLLAEHVNQAIRLEKALGKPSNDTVIVRPLGGVTSIHTIKLCGVGDPRLPAEEEQRLKFGFKLNYKRTGKKYTLSQYKADHRREREQEWRSDYATFRSERADLAKRGELASMEFGIDFNTAKGAPYDPLEQIKRAKTAAAYKGQVLMTVGDIEKQHPGRIDFETMTDRGSSVPIPTKCLVGIKLRMHGHGIQKPTRVYDKHWAKKGQALYRAHYKLPEPPPPAPPAPVVPLKLSVSLLKRPAAAPSAAAAPVGSSLPPPSPPPPRKRELTSDEQKEHDQRLVLAMRARHPTYSPTDPTLPPGTWQYAYPRGTDWDQTYLASDRAHEIMRNHIALQNQLDDAERVLVSEAVSRPDHAQLKKRVDAKIAKVEAEGKELEKQRDDEMKRITTVRDRIESDMERVSGDLARQGSRRARQHMLQHQLDYHDLHEQLFRTEHEIRQFLARFQPQLDAHQQTLDDLKARGHAALAHGTRKLREAEAQRLQRNRHAVEVAEEAFIKFERDQTSTLEDRLRNPQEWAERDAERNAEAVRERENLARAAVQRTATMFEPLDDEQDEPMPNANMFEPLA